MNKIFRSALVTAAGLSCAFFLSIPTASGSVAGTLATGSTGTVTATIDSVTFNNDPAAQPASGGSNFSCPTGSLICDSDVATSTSLTFAGCSSGVLGSPGCLSVGEGVDVNSPITIASVPEANFLTFSNNASLVFSLTGVTTFTNTNCAALMVTQSCVVFAGSPLLLTLEPNNQTEVQLFVTGTASDTGDAGLLNGTPYSGFFSSNITSPIAGAATGFTAPTPADIQLFFCGTNTVTPTTVCSSTASITSSQSGSFTATPVSGVPEPTSMAMLMMGGGLIMVAARRRSRTR